MKLVEKQTVIVNARISFSCEVLFTHHMNIVEQVNDIYNLFTLPHKCKPVHGLYTMSYRIILEIMVINYYQPF